MAAKIRDAAGVEPGLIKSSGGVFEVSVDGELVFSKRNTGRFPDEDALAEKIARRTS